MIPRRIALNGFLCYRDEQVIDLDGCDLWVFSGRNGSGKSAIFDAMTFALFGAHRGGRRDAANLINTDSSEFTVAFDFDLGPDRYRIRRSLRRNGRAERQVFRFEPDESGPGRWPAVPETDSDAGLKRWVQEHVGLTYETFTASVLLMQGKAERLLGALPRERHEILAGIVDLARYQDLARRADQRRQEKKALAEALRTQLRGLPEVEPAAIEAAGDRLGVAEGARAVAEAEWKRLVGVEAQARSWLGLFVRRIEACRKLNHAQQVMAHSASIGRDWTRLRELDAVLPTVREAIARRGKLHRAEAEARRREEERKTSVRKLDLMAGLAEDNRRHLRSIVEEIERDEGRRLHVSNRLVEFLSGPIARARLAQSHRAEIVRIERQLAFFPDNLPDEVGRLEDDHRRCADWKAALPFLTTLARERDGLAEARRWITTARHAIEAGEAEILRFKTALVERQVEETTARQAEHEARDDHTEAATLRRSAEARLDQFERLRNAPTCDRCGQSLTPEHYATEASRLRDERDRAARAVDAADRVHRLAQEHRAAAEKARAEGERALQRAQTVASDANREIAQAEREAQGHLRHCLDAYEHLAEPFRASVAVEPPADWLTTTFPTPNDLVEGQHQKAAIGPVEARLEEARRRLMAMQADQTRLEQARQALAAVGLEPGDEAAEEEQAALSAEGESLARCLRGHTTQRMLAEETLAKLTELAREWNQRRSEAENRLASERSRAEMWTEEAARARGSAPEAWRDILDTATDTDLADWEAEGRTLRARGTEALAADLPQAQLLVKQAESEIHDLDRQIAEIPEEARRDPKEVAALKAEVWDQLDRAEEDRRAKQGELDALRRDQERRRALDARTLDAERALVVAETLARLLGRDGLQRDLLREAERGILDCANPILRELSGDELELRLLDGGNGELEDALEMEALVRTHGRTRVHDVDYLSGSQKFRVAVSLALGIGQFARGLHRPIESVVIDEGFGCLDRQGRDEMIAQLNALKGRLARIVLVSHQEEFADAFPDGYRFEVIEGSTRAQPFHR